MLICSRPNTTKHKISLDINTKKILHFLNYTPSDSSTLPHKGKGSDIHTALLLVRFRKRGVASVLVSSTEVAWP